MNFKRSFFINCFEVFFSKILENKVRIERGVFFEPGKELVEKKSQVANLQSEFLLMVKDQSAVVFSDGGLMALSYFDECAYIMLALADEIFIKLDWEFREYWRNSLLEEQYFKSHNAGEQIFVNLANFLKERDVSKGEVGMIYLYALSLGFEGKYRDNPKKNEIIKGIKANIFKLIHKIDPQLHSKMHWIFPQTKQYTIESSANFYDNTMRNLTVVAFSLITVFLFAAQFIWHNGTAEIWSVTEQSLRMIKEME
jgi:type IV/VI secretion system ImpK/VasF family protein